MSLFPSVSPPIPTSSPKECPHTTVEYGLCFVKSRDQQNENDIETSAPMEDKFECNYKTMLKDYSVSNRGTKEELARYHRNYSKWYHIQNLVVTCGAHFIT